MFSPLNDPQLEQWFERFNAPLKRLPAEERAALHLEVRQHLEALAAANEELGSAPEEAWQFALEQFGNPARIGKKLYQEWRQGKTETRSSLRAVIFGMSLHWLKSIIYVLVIFIGNYSIGNTFPHAPDKFGTPWMSIIFENVTTVLIAFAVGRKYYNQAIKGVLYSQIVCEVYSLIEVTVILSKAYGNYSPQLTHFLSTSLWWIPLWLTGHVAIAYLASVTKRGWYRPTWADFKLSLPRRRPQLSR